MFFVKVCTSSSRTRDVPLRKNHSFHHGISSYNPGTLGYNLGKLGYNLGNASCNLGNPGDSLERRSYNHKAAAYIVVHAPLFCLKAAAVTAQEGTRTEVRHRFCADATQARRGRIYKATAARCSRMGGSHHFKGCIYDWRHLRVQGSHAQMRTHHLYGSSFPRFAFARHL